MVIQTIFTDIRSNAYEKMFPNDQKDHTYINLITNCGI